MPERLPDQSEQRRDAESWRGSDFASLDILERWLATQGLDVPHDEPDANGDGSYQHPGYKPVPCRVCQQPTIVGIASFDVSCGRPDCDTGLLGSGRPSSLPTMNGRGND